MVVVTSSPTARVFSGVGTSKVTFIPSKSPSTSKSSSGAGSYILADEKTGKVGYASAGVEAVYSGSKSQGTAQPTYIRGVGGGVRLTPATTVITQPSGSTAQRLSRSDVVVSQSLYNKYLKDTGSPLRRASGTDTAVLTSGRQRVKDSLGGGGFPLPYSRFQESSQPYIEAMRVEKERKQQQEIVINRAARGTFAEGSYIYGEALVNKGLGLVSRAEGMYKSGKVGNVLLATPVGITGGLLGTAGELIKQPYYYGRDVSILTGGFGSTRMTKEERGLFTPAEKISAGLNTGVRGFAFGYGIFKGASVPSSTLTGSDKLLMGAGALGVGYMGFDYLTTPAGEQRTRKGFEYGGSLVGLGILGGAGQSIGREYNPYLRLSAGNLQGQIVGSGLKRYEGTLKGKVLINGKIAKAPPGYAVPKTIYKIDVPARYITTTAGRNTGGGSFVSLRIDQGTTYFSSSYKSFFGNTYYARGKISSSGFTNVKYFKGDTLKGAASFKGSPLGFLGEDKLQLKQGYRLIDYDYTREELKSVGFKNLISRKYTGGTADILSSDVTIFTAKTGGIAKASRFNIIGAFDYSGGSQKAYGDVIKTRYVPVDYIPKAEALRINIKDFGASVSKPANTIVYQRVTSQRFFSFNKKGNIPLPNPLSLVTSRNVPLGVRGAQFGKSAIFGDAAPKLKPSLVLIPGLNLRSSPSMRLKPSFDNVLSPRMISSPRSTVSFKPITIPRLTTTTRLMTKTIPDLKITPDLKLSLTPDPSINIDVGIDTPPPPPPPIIPPPTPFYFPRGSGFRPGRRYNGIPGVFKPKYTASVTASVLGIKGRKPSKMLIESGITLRPIPRGL